MNTELEVASETTTAPASPRRSRLRGALLDPAEDQPRWTGWEAGALLLYAAAVAFGIAQHVPWADEAQAWMLAQEVSLGHLLAHSLHYEGTPGLWHVFLMLLQFLHLSFTAMRWIVGGIAVGSTAVLLAYAPFPRIVRLLLPFSFFLAYQDAVIARSYALFAILAFPAAAMLRSVRFRPILLAVVLGLMAQISVHGAIASGGLAIVAISKWRRQRSRVEISQAIAATLLVLVFWAGAIVTMFPAPDIDYVAGNNVQRSIAKIERQVGLNVEVPELLSDRRMANRAPTLPAVHVRHGWLSFWNKFVRTLSVMTYPLSVFRTLALVLVLLIFAQACWRPRALIGGRLISQQEAGPGGPLGAVGLAPYLLMMLVFTSLYLAPRHVGMVFTTFVVSAWLTWPGVAGLYGRRLLLERVTAVVFTLMLLGQLSWTYHALRMEHLSLYSPDRETAEYLRQQGVGKPGSDKQAAAYYYYSIGPLLYFDHNIFFNQPPHRYWFWSTSMRTYGTVEGALARHPDYIIIGGYDSGHDAEITRDWQPITPPEPGVLLGDGFHLANFFLSHGYHEMHLFCGHSWMRSTYAERICQTVLEPNTR